MQLTVSALINISTFRLTCYLCSAVSYLPMPVIGGYLAFIGYFCIEAGIGLAISQNIMSIQDWLILFQSSKNMLLALPAFIAGFILTYITRNVKNDIVLPLAMILIPGLFYFAIFSCNIGMDGARNGGWMGGTLMSFFLFRCYIYLSMYLNETLPLPKI